MTPRERQENAQRSARRGPVYEAIGFGIVVLIATLIAGPFGFLFMLVVGALLLVLGLLVGIVRGPAKRPGGPDGLPPA
ncbi:MAG: hypothetical protein HOE75_13410 [Chloroflexi bacterium]|nr:hypothetical protein [Chloroflexota bacterium]